MHTQYHRGPYNNTKRQIMVHYLAEATCIEMWYTFWVRWALDYGPGLNNPLNGLTFIIMYNNRSPNRYCLITNYCSFCIVLLYLPVHIQLDINRCLFSIFTNNKQCVHNLNIYQNRKWMVTREAHGAYRAGNLSVQFVIKDVIQQSFQKRTNISFLCINHFNR